MPSFKLQMHHKKAELSQFKMTARCACALYRCLETLDDCQESLGTKFYMGFCDDRY